VFDAIEFGGKPVLKEPGKVVFKAEYGSTPVSRSMAHPPQGLDVHDGKAVAKTVTVDEEGPARVVLLVKGNFEGGGNASRLDFQCRYYALAGSPSVRLAFTIIHRRATAFDQFVGIRSLGFELPLALDGDKTFAVGASEGDDPEGALASGEKVVQMQPSSLEYVLSGKVEGKGKCRNIDTRRVGWISVAGKDAAVTTGMKWFWKLHPKGQAVTGDGVMKTYMVPPQAEKAQVPEEEYCETFARIDLYCGGARTHDVLFAFHKPGGAAEARARAMGVMEPLFAACPTDWYCQKTQGFGRIYDIKLENYHPQFRDAAKRYELHVDNSWTGTIMRATGKALKDFPIRSYFEITKKNEKTGKLANTRWCSAQKLEEYGWMTYGSHVEHGSKVKMNDSLNTQFDGNYYDYPRAVLLRFVRSGMAHYWDEAQSAGLHLADIDICHWHPKNQALNGIEHVCPNAGHFRTFWPGRRFQPSGNVHSCKSQSLYELYNLTGDKWYQEAGVLSGTYLTNHRGGNVRGRGNRITGLLCAYRSTRDEKFGSHWKNDAVNITAAGAVKKIGESGRGKWDQAWQYGLGCEAMMDYYLITGDKTVAKALKLAADSLMTANWGGRLREYHSLAGFTLPVFGYAYEVTGDIKYMRYGLEHLERTIKSYAGRSKTFAQMARISPQFLYYLSKDYVPPKPIYGGKEKADPVLDALKEAKPEEKPKPKKEGIGEL
jgi:hypothetical protein